jgi:hypothetical protein
MPRQTKLAYKAQTQRRRNNHPDSEQSAVPGPSSRSLSDEERRRRNRTRAQECRARRQCRTENLALTTAANSVIDESCVLEHFCGKMDAICEFCQAKHFQEERPPDRKFTTCCQKGKVELPQFRDYPLLLKNLLMENHEKSANFLEHIRSFNSAFGFASMGANLVSPGGRGPYCFKIHGQIYHRTGTLHPQNEQPRVFSQIYILDTEEATECRKSKPENEGCDGELMQLLGELMTDINPFAEAYKMLHEVELEMISQSAETGILSTCISMAIKQDRKTDPRRYNAPKANEVAIVFSNTDGEPPLERDLIIHLRGNQTNTNEPKVKRISVLDPNLEPMVYPLLFPHGDQGWSSCISLQGAKVRTRVTQMQYYGYRFAVRDGFNPLLNAGKLTQQFFVDAFVKTEANRLNYLRMNQSKLRVDMYSGLLDHINSPMEVAGALPGKPVILPSSFQGSPRNMHQNYQDAMAIVRKYGKPDFFITMTCNPMWNEIRANLEAWQKVEHRPDLVARVFNLKLKELLNDLCKNHVFGKVIGKVHVIEFQKRGLPHAHILIVVSGDHKPNSKEAIDAKVCAEIPDEITNPKLQQLVLKHMIHGPCGSSHSRAPCMESGECTKGFPKPIVNETQQNVDGYPRYKRRFSYKQYEVRKFMVDNSWVVPYNPYLLLKFNCHINVEVCASVKSVKYLFKYVYKGHDCANLEIKEVNVDTVEHNEIIQHMDSRYH